MFGRRADELLEALREVFGDVEAIVNVKAPRRGSFEITLLKDSEGKKIYIWLVERKTFYLSINTLISFI